MRNLPAEGKVIATTPNNNEIHARYPDVRRWMDFANLVYNTTTDTFTTTGLATNEMIRHITALEPGKYITVGFLKPTTTWTKTEGSTTHAKMSYAIQHVVRNILNYPNTFACRAGRAIPRFPSCSEADYTVLVYWGRSFDNAQIFEAESNGPISTKQVVGADYETKSYLQLLCSRTTTHEQPQLDDVLRPDDDNDSNNATPSDTAPNDPDRLSAIPEEDEDVDFDALASEAYFNIDHEADEICASVSDRQFDSRIHVHEACHYYTAGASLDGLNETNEADEHGNAYVEILFPGEYAKLILDQEPPPNTCARMQVFPAGAGIKKSVIETDTDLLTPEEYYKHAKEVTAAMLEELKIWITHGCFTRRPRKGASNILDCKWVGKWKYAKAKDDPSKKVRIIRMRLTLRGFKDRDANDILTYAGTSSRLSQKLLVSEAVNRGWKIVALDVSKAFLKGVSYQELAKATGEPQREVNFELSNDANQPYAKYHNSPTSIREQKYCTAINPARAAKMLPEHLASSWQKQRTTHSDSYPRLTTTNWWYDTKTENSTV